MLDKAVGAYFPAILNERSELKSAFDGFTYYPNTISYFRATLLGAPPLFGGYEYTPEKLHERKNDLMRTKHNESYLMLPTLFSRNGFSVSVYDLPYFNYQSRMGVSFFASLGMNADNLDFKFTDRYLSEFKDKVPAFSGKTALILKHNFVFFSFFTAAPVLLREFIYDNGNYWAAIDNIRLDVVRGSALRSYAALHYLPELTGIQDGNNTFTILVSNMAHDASFLQYPDYTVVSEINDFGPDLFNGNITSFQYYHVNAASYLLLAKWFDWLKSNNVYDNTRIIIVSDHADFVVDPLRSLKREYTAYNPVLLFKDFNSRGDLKKNMEFMTNADTPLLAVRDIFPGAKNPFTGKALEADKADGALVFLGGSSQPQDYPGNEALDKTSQFYHVKENIYDEKNWTKITKRY
jgi:hypothetical protein